jgi:hypothetical protein
MTKIVVICQLLAFPAHDWRTHAPTWAFGSKPKCYSENDIVPEELQADDATTKSLASKIDELVKKMEAP